MTDITIAGPDGTFSAYVAKPAKPGPGVLVIQEIFGVNRVMRDLCDSLAGQGYVALCADLFWRQQPGIQLTDQSEAEWQRAFQLYQGFDEAKGVLDLKAALAQLRKLPGCTGKVGSVGYCLGGKLAYLMATRSDADCNVGYYGVGIEKALDEAGSITRPLLLHFAAEDQFVPKSAQAMIQARLASVNAATVHVYPGVDHAFARVGGAHWNEATARAANDRTAAFFAAHLK